MVQGENHKRKWKNISGSERAERLGQRPPESNTLRLNLHNKIDWNSRNWPQGNKSCSDTENKAGKNSL